MLSDLLKLAERCEAATGPDRGLDGRIAYALGWRFNGLSAGANDPDFDEWEDIAGHWARPGSDFCPVDRSFSSEDYPDPPEWTASIDAAMTLVPEHYHPSWLLRKAIDDCLIAVGQSGDECMRRLPLFICAAALRARSEAAAVGGR